MYSFRFLEKQIPYKTKPVRGKARMELPGWACRECEDVSMCMIKKTSLIKQKINGIFFVVL